MRTTTKTILSAFALSMVAAPSFASEVEFRYQAHELETAGGVEILFKRLSRKAEAACTDPGVRTLAQRDAETTCIASLTRELVGNIDDRRLNRVYARETRGDVYVAQNAK